MRLAHPKPYRLRRTKLFHVYQATYAATDFNPHSTGRFAVLGRGMYYAGTTPEIALWESILRHVVPEADGTVLLPDTIVSGKVLAQVETSRSMSILDLCMPHLRVHAGTEAEWEAWLRFTSTVDHVATHPHAQALLASYPGIQGLRWTSKQAGRKSAFVFYSPPDDLFVSRATQPLDDGTVGWRLIDKALKQAKITRIDPRAIRVRP